MRGHPFTLPLNLSPACIEEAQLYSGLHGADAVEAIVFAHGKLIAERRTLSKRVAQLDDEGRALDERIEELKAVARAILEL